MRSLLKWLIVISVVLVLICGVGYFAGLPFLGPYLKPEIEKQVSAATQSEFSMEALAIESLYPVRLMVSGVQFIDTKNGLTAKVAKIKVVATPRSLVFDYKNLKLDTQVLVEGPNIEVNLKQQALKAAQAAKNTGRVNQPGPKGQKVATAPPANQTGSADLGAFDTSIDLKITDGSLSLSVDPETTVSVQKLNVEVKKSTIKFANDSTSIKLATNLKIMLAKWPVALPVRFESESVRLSKDYLTIDQMNLDAGGLQMSAKGFTKLDDMTGQWSSQIDIKDLSKLPEPPKFLPAGQWAGSVKAKFSYIQKKDYPPYVKGDIQARQLSGQVNLNQEGLIFRGPAKAQLETAFTYYQKLKVSHLDFSADLNQAEIKYRDSFAKPKGVVLNAKAMGQLKGDRFELQTSELQFAKLRAAMSGQFSTDPKKSSNGSIKIPQISLDGMQRFFPFLKDYPLKGEVELDGRFAGVLSDPEKLNIKLSPFKAKNVSTYIKLKDAKSGIDVEGPVSLDAYAVIEANGADLKKANVTLQSNLSRLKFKMGETINKTAKHPLTIDLRANKKGKLISISKGNISFYGGSAQLKGTLSRPQRPKLNISLVTPKVDLKKLAEIAPILKQFNIVGTVTSDLKVTGTFDPKKGIEKSPLTARGTLVARIPSYEMSEPPESTETSAPAGTPKGTNKGAGAKPKSEPMLPSWPIMKNSKLTASVRLEKFKYGSTEAIPGKPLKIPLEMRKIALDGQYDGGKVLASGTIGRVFGGSASVRKAGGNLLKKRPIFSGRANLKGVQLDPAITWAMPDKAGMVKGQVFGDVSGSVPFPLSEEFLKTVKSSGEVKLANVVVKGEGIGKLINEQLSKYPQIAKGKTVKVQNVNAKAGVKYSMKDGVISIANLNLLTSDQHEFRGKGTFNLDFESNLKGTAYLMNPPIRGSVYEANKDKKGRFVLPMSIKGNLMEPKVDFAQATINQLVKNTLEYEKKKELKKAEVKLKKQLNKKAKNLGKDLEKGLKGLFK